MIHFLTDSVLMPSLVANQQLQLQRWIRTIASSYGFAVGDVNYIFCSDSKILAVNQQFLSHDYYTDIITFDYSSSSLLSGDIFISLDTVASNAEGLGVSFNDELTRVLIHGILHLTGQEDKTPETRLQMTAKEDLALAKWQSILTKP